MRIFTSLSTFQEVPKNRTLCFAVAGCPCEFFLARVVGDDTCLQGHRFLDLHSQLCSGKRDLTGSDGTRHAGYAAAIILVRSFRTEIPGIASYHILCPGSIGSGIHDPVHGCNSRNMRCCHGRSAGRRISSIQPAASDIDPGCRNIKRGAIIGKARSFSV